MVPVAEEVVQYLVAGHGVLVGGHGGVVFSGFIEWFLFLLHKVTQKMRTHVRKWHKFG